jgi:hypothetical protein
MGEGREQKSHCSVVLLREALDPASASWGVSAHARVTGGCRWTWINMPDLACIPQHPDRYRVRWGHFRPMGTLTHRETTLTSTCQLTSPESLGRQALGAKGGPFLPKYSGTQFWDRGQVLWKLLGFCQNREGDSVNSGQSHR